MIVIAGCTGDLSKKKLFPAIDKVLKRKLSECTGGSYIKKELCLTDGTLSSSTSSAHNLNKHSPITIANPEDPLKRKMYIEATESRILHSKIGQGDIFKNNCIEVPKIVGYARSQLNTVEFIRRIDPNVAYLKETVEKIEYCSGEYNKMIDKVYEMLEKEDSMPASLYIYLAVPPEIYPDILSSITDRLDKESVQADAQKKASRINPIVLIEKPIGTSMSTFQKLKLWMDKYPDRFLCVDHYLFKNVMTKYKDIFNSSILKELVVPGSIKKVKGYFNEVIDVKGRERYYNMSGACRDVLQNHLLLAVATVLAGNSDRMDVIKIIEPLKPENTLFGIYKEYAEITAKTQKALDLSEHFSVSDPSANQKVPSNVQTHADALLDTSDVPLDASIKETFIKTKTTIAHPWNISLKMTAGKKMDVHYVAVILILTDKAVQKLIHMKTHAADYENIKLIEKIDKILCKKQEESLCTESSDGSAVCDNVEQSIYTEESQKEIDFLQKKSAHCKTVVGKIKVKITPKEAIFVEIKYKNKLAKKINIPIPNTEDNIDAYEHLFNQLIFENKVYRLSLPAEIMQQWKIVDPILDHSSITRIRY